jgi:hypothetical protein
LRGVWTFHKRHQKLLYKIKYKFENITSLFMFCWKLKNNCAFFT